MWIGVARPITQPRGAGRKWLALISRPRQIVPSGTAR